VTRGRSNQYKPIASIGILDDGGIFVAPAAVRDFGWTYGNLGAKSDPANHVSTFHRPKVHYHSSGIVRATLSGKDLESRSAYFPKIDLVRRAQLFSIVCTRPSELATARSRPEGAGDGGRPDGKRTFRRRSRPEGASVQVERLPLRSVSRRSDILLASSRQTPNEARSVITETIAGAARRAHMVGSNTAVIGLAGLSVVATFI
jgi:hypothetical protein